MKQISYTSILRSNNGISRVRLNDPDTYNSMSFNMLNSLIAALKDLDKDKKTRIDVRLNTPTRGLIRYFTTPFTETKLDNKADK